MSVRGLYVLNGLSEIQVLTLTAGSGQSIGKHPMVGGCLPMVGLRPMRITYEPFSESG